MDSNSHEGVAPIAFVLRTWPAHAPGNAPVWRIRAQRVNQDAPRVFESWTDLAVWLEQEATRALAAPLAIAPAKGDAP